MESRPPRPIRARRLTLLTLIVGAVVCISCDSPEGAAAFRACAVCGYVANAERESLVDEHEARSACGTCPEGTGCNPLHRPPRCAPDPGVEGDLCGLAYGTEYACERGFQCTDGVCRVLPGVGDPCDFATDESVTLSHPNSTHCGPGLVCGTDEHCRVGCAAECPLLQRCSPLEDPPQCRPDPPLPGDRCGRVHRFWSLECLPLYACVDRGSGGRCELTAGDGEPCGAERCPAGFQCDTARELCVASSGAL